jgi:hypothetical protein
MLTEADDDRPAKLRSRRLQRIHGSGARDRPRTETALCKEPSGRDLLPARAERGHPTGNPSACARLRTGLCHEEQDRSRPVAIHPAQIQRHLAGKLVRIERARELGELRLGPIGKRALGGSPSMRPSSSSRRIARRPR